MFKKKLSSAELKKGVFDLFDKITISHYLEVYLSSSKIDCTFFIKLGDHNGADDLFSIAD